jgi:hypothetical protein
MPLYAFCALLRADAKAEQRLRIVARRNDQRFGCNAMANFLPRF